MSENKTEYNVEVNGCYKVNARIDSECSKNALDQAKNKLCEILNKSGEDFDITINFMDATVNRDNQSVHREFNSNLFNQEGYAPVGTESNTFYDEEECENSYYYHNGVMAWDLIDRILLYHEGGLTNREAGILYNILKYLLRFPYKGYKEEDLKKARNYIDQLIGDYFDEIESV